MTSPYREVIYPRIEPDREVFRYVRHPKQFDPHEIIHCPVCSQQLDPAQIKFFKFWDVCSPWRRQSVAGWLWWSKDCPLPDTHRHARCNHCLAHIVSQPADVTIEAL